MTKSAAALLDIVFLCLVALFVVIAAVRFNYYAGLVPLIIGIPCFLLGMVKLIQTLRGTPLTSEPGNRDPSAPASPVSPSMAEGRNRELRAVSWILGTGLTLYLFGFSMAVHGFLIVFIRWGIKESWKTTLLSTGFIFVLYYGIFVKLVHVGFWPGLLYQLIFG